MARLSARSALRFPSLAGPVCPWHEDCTPMDCENWRVVPKAEPVSSGNLPSVIKSVPIKPSKRRNK